MLTIDSEELYNKLQLNECETVYYIVRHEAVQKMRVGPSESACRSRLQTT